jgi:hypothetical protein
MALQYIVECMKKIAGVNWSRSEIIDLAACGDGTTNSAMLAWFER